VKISEPEDLVISNALIEGNNVTVQAANGIPPYRYKLDNGAYQTSSLFENVPKGDHTVEVMDACGSVTENFSIVNVINIITPNSDGVNDFINYSALLQKLEPRFEIYDRNGVLIFKGDTNNQFIWDGKSGGRILPTSSYWYILEWNESGNPKRTQLSGWILLKNRS
jgi:gliding motility-associated-like protein